MESRYYELTFDDADPDALVCYRYSLQGFDRYKLLEGSPIAVWPSNVTLYYAEGHPEDCIGNALGWLVCSSRVQHIFEEMRISNVQFLPILVLNENTGENLQGYAVLNILSVISALDKAHAIYEEDPVYPELPIIIKVALSIDRIQGEDIFRLKEQPSLIFISHRLKEGLEAAEVTGLRFIPVPTF